MWYVAEGGSDPPTSGLWVQHASSAPLCYLSRHVLAVYILPSLNSHTRSVCLHIRKMRLIHFMESQYRSQYQILKFCFEAFVMF